MTVFRKISRYILGFDDTQHSEQEAFIKDLYSSQKHAFKELSRKQVTDFLDSLIKKHDLIDFGLVQDKQIILSTENFNKKDILKFYEFFDNIKDSLKDRIVLLRDNPWIGMFEKDKFVFVTKKEVKLSEFEINAITHDVLNSRELFLGEIELAEFATIKTKHGM
jgi:hypothetical protein